MKQYKDECDVCNKFDYCKGLNGLVVCRNCYENMKKENQAIADDVIVENQTSIYDFLQKNKTEY